MLIKWPCRPPIVLVLQVIYQCLLLFHAWMPVLNRLVPLVGYRPTLTIAGYLITNVAFVYAAIYLYKLTLYVMENEDQAWRVLCLFCFNPASVFYSSMYPLFYYPVILNLWNNSLMSNSIVVSNSAHCEPDFWWSLRMRPTLRVQPFLVYLVCMYTSCFGLVIRLQ